MIHRGVPGLTAAADVIAALFAAARARAVTRSVGVAGAGMLVLALPQGGVAARASSQPNVIAVKQSSAALPPGTKVTFSAATSFTDSCSGTWLASPGCAAPNWAGNLAYGPAQVSYNWTGSGTLTSSDPVNAKGQGSAPLTESKIAIGGSGTWSEKTSSCQISATSGVASTGHSVPSVLKAHLTPITNRTGVVTGFKLLTSLAYPPGGGGPGPAELENWSWQQTANPDTGVGPCTSGSYPHLNEPDGNAGQAVYDLAYFDGNVTAAGKIEITGWTINHSWSIKTGGVWATKTISRKIPYNYYSDPTVTDQGNITVAETYRIVTSP
jgi:hypothetical protein